MIRTGAQYLASIRDGRDLAAVYRGFNWDGPLDFVRKAAGFLPRGKLGTVRASSDTAIAQHFAGKAAE